MIVVNKDLCLACGRCAITCFRGAISLDSGQAEIDQSRCNGCGVCIDSCAQCAISVINLEPVSAAGLFEQVSGLQSKTDDILQRIAQLKRK